MAGAPCSRGPRIFPWSMLYQNFHVLDQIKLAIQYNPFTDLVKYHKDWPTTWSRNISTQEVLNYYTNSHTSRLIIWNRTLKNK
jgi:hypothetical protein